MTNWARDIRYGLRMLIRNKGFTAVAILALALGIGPNVAIFSIVWATFLAPLPYHDANQLVVVWTKFKGERNATRGDDYAQYAAQSQSFQRLDFQSWSIMHLTNQDHSQEDNAGIPVTPGMHTKNLGLHMAMGRDFLPDEGKPGKDHFVILTHRLWQEHFQADTTILGKPILIDDEPYIVVGVLEPGVADRISGTQFIVPLVLTQGVHSNSFGNVFGRLKPGVTLAQAQAELAVIDRRLPSVPGDDDTVREFRSVSVEPLKNDWLDHKLERNLWLLLAAVGFVLLIACANVANLLLARGSARQQELAVRSALGASRRQVFAQLLTESLTLAILGGAIGITLGFAIMKLSMAILPDLAKQTAEAVVEVNLPVLCFATAITIIGGVLFGCAPAWQAARLNLVDTLKAGSRSVIGHGRMRIQGVLVTAEFALALTLLGGAGMALHSFWRLTQIDLGVQTDHVLTAYLQPHTTGHRGAAPTVPPPRQILAGQRQMMDNLRAVPGVQEVALTTTIPLQGYDSFPFSIVGQPVDSAHRPVADFQGVTPSFFKTFGIRLMRGRFLNDSDTVDSLPTIMVSETFVRRYLSAVVDPLTQRLLIPTIVPNQNQLGPPAERQIVGIFHDVLNNEHLTGTAQPAMFISLGQMPWPYVALAVRTSVDPGAVTHAVRGTLAQAAPGVTMVQIQTMEEIVDTQRTGDRFGMVLFGGFAAVALLLAALGIYGVMSFAVAQRTHEIGLRMALGAQRNEVVMLMVRGGMKLAFIGAGIGLVGVYGLGQIMHSTLYGVGRVDFSSVAIVATLLLAVAVLASWLPARRTARIDPVIALREE
jgi:putative ABC transport system permease protein